MKPGWEKKTLRDLCLLISGQHIDSKNYNTDSRGFGYLTGPSDFGPIHPTVTKWTEFPKVKATCGDILLTVKGSGVGKINLLDQDGVVISRQLMAIRVKEAEPLFIYAYLRSVFSHFQELSTGAAIPGISRDQVLGLEIDLPPLLEQKRIVAILDDAFERIDTAIANTEKNLANARELFESYLSKAFDAKAHGWPIKKFEDICENLDSRRIPITKSKRESGEIPYYGASGVVDYVKDFIFNEDILLVSEDGANLLARTYPIAFSVSGKSWVNNHAHVLRFKNKSTQTFVELYLNSISLEPYVSGMAQPKLNQKAMNSIPIPLPEVDMQRAMVSKLTEIKEAASEIEENYKSKLASMGELKQSLLQKAFAGELTTDFNPDSLVN